jgi:peptide/nickel transport system substrate-binding protein
MYEEDRMTDRPFQAKSFGKTLGTSLSRRDLMKRAAIVGVGTAAFVPLLAACDSDDDDVDVDPVDETDDDVEDAEPAVEPDEDVEPDDDPEPDEDQETDEEEDDDEESRYGGTLNVAIVGDPPTLDVTTTTAQIVGFFSWHIWEPLFTWDEDLEVTPHLAETHEVSDDGLTNSLTLREGVLFHNGEEMTSEDVIASIERWLVVSPRASGIAGRLDEMEPIDDYSIEFQMNAPYGAFQTILARLTGGCAISPASAVDAAGENALDEFIGTGPFQFVEYVPDQHILLERFDDYVSREEEPSGYAGRRTPYLDEIRFIPASDESARIAGLQAGDFHYLEVVTADQFDALQGDESVTTEELPPEAFRIFVFNTQEGILSDQTMRRAMQATFDNEELAVAGHGEHYRLDPGILIQSTVWHTTAGEEYYNMADPDLGWELAQEAGYDGEPIRILTSQEQPDMYNMAAVGQQQLEDAGFTVELVLTDWATLLQQREDPEAWDIFTTGAGLTLDPLLMSFVTSTTWPGWWDSDAKVELVRQLEDETEFDVRYEIWEELQQLFYEVDVPMIKVADMINFNARSPYLRGFQPIDPVAGGVGFWNMWLEED